jgi:hypothetical protein
MRGLGGAEYHLGAGGGAGYLRPMLPISLGSVAWSANVWRGVSASLTLGMRLGDAVDRQIDVGMASALAAALQADAPLPQGKPLAMSSAIIAAHALRLSESARVGLARAAGVGVGAQARWKRTYLFENSRGCGLSAGLWLGAGIAAKWNEAARLNPFFAFRSLRAESLSARLDCELRGGIALDAAGRIILRLGRAPRFFSHPAIVIPVKPPPFHGSARLVLRGALSGARLILGRVSRPLRFLPVREVYTVANSAHCKRVDDGTEIQCSSIRISGDRDTWGRRFSLNSFWSEQEKLNLMDGPVEVEIGANGVVWRALLTRMKPVDKFAGRQLSLEGVSLSACLAAPYAQAAPAANASDMLAQQIAAARLEFTDWSLEWLLPDWLIPAGIASWASATPMEVIKALASAPGGYLQTDRAAPVLRALPSYPVPAWQWGSATPDVVLTPDIIDEMAPEWVESPRYNCVYVSGQNAGVNAQIVRDGTAGDKLAPMIVDPLLTEIAANRARGIAVLSEAGPAQNVQLSLALYPEIGPIEPGTFVQAGAWIGLARGLEINIAWNGAGGLEIRQSVEIERRFADA